MRAGGKGASVTQRDYWVSGVVLDRRRSVTADTRGAPPWWSCRGRTAITARRRQRPASAGRRPIRWWAAGLRAAGRAGTGPGMWKRPTSRASGTLPAGLTGRARRGLSCRWPLVGAGRPLQVYRPW